MAPNQLQSAHIAEKCIAALNLKNGPVRISDRPLIRTEYVISSVYYYQLELSDDSVLKSAANPVEAQVSAAFRNLVDEFRLAYLEPITALCGQLAIPADSLTAVFGGVANELFCEGITWARIVTLCVFASELAAKCLKENSHESVVEEIRMCLLHYVQVNLKNWIFDHGWERSRRSGHNVTEKLNRCVAKWAELPAPALEQIFTHLSHQDRFCASMVCTNWSTVYGCPLLWRSPVFCFPGTKREAIGYAGKKFVKRYGKYFKRLYLSCQRPTIRGLFPMQIAMYGLVKILGCSEIKKLECLKMKKLLYHSCRTILRINVLRYFRRFLRKQDHLKTVDLSQGNVSNDEGLLIIRILSRMCGSSVTDLRLTDFLQRNIIFRDHLLWARLFSNFLTLQVLHLNYGMVTEDLFNVLGANLQQTLRVMSIFVPCEIVRFAQVNEASWNIFKSTCKLLLVDFQIVGLYNQHEYQQIIPRSVPLRKVKYVSPSHINMNDFNYDSMFQYFGSFNGTLEAVSLKLHSSERSLPFAMRALFPVCHFLERINIIMPMPIDFLDRLFNTLISTRTALKIFRLTLIDVGREDCRHSAENLRSKYVPLLKDVGIKLQLVVKK